MPSTYSNSPFISLRPDKDCGRNGSPSNNRSFSSLSGANTPSASYPNGSTTHGNGAAAEDEFLRLDAPQQDLLLLHGPRQKYSLERSKDIPDLQGDREILVQVLAIGLNPVDWKGADYGFGQPSYPWVNGRDFAGIVVRAPRSSSRVKHGDVVFGASTDYRDVRKAAYQEYAVTTDYNVTRIPQGVSVKEGAALGVAYVAAIISLGVSFGLDFSNVRTTSRGPDLLSLTRSLPRSQVGDDIQSEIFDGISDSERPEAGEWIAIWGANSMTGQTTLQLAKHAGLKVACVADIARGGARLSELGADFMVDKYDDQRAVDILKAVTGGKLRFGIDCNGSESAAILQQALEYNSTGKRSHLLGLAGMPKTIGKGVVHHQVPIKIFHEAPVVGEAASTWLEDLLVHRGLKLPEVEIAEGGLSGINTALDRMRTGKISGKRIVVPVAQDRNGSNSPSPTNGNVPNGISSVGATSDDLSYADSLNGDPERLRFAYWVPNVSGGLVISKIKQRTHWDLKSNIRYARIAEQNGFEYALSQIRFMAGYGAENQHEPVSLSQAMLMATQRLKVIAALLPGPWNPAVAAKMIASIDNYTDGRVCVNVVSGWFRAEFASIGQWWLDHAERYRRSREFITCLKGIWTNDSFTFKGDFYQFHDYPLKPKPLNLPGRPYPEIFQGGNSDDAKENAASVSDYYFMNGNTLEGFQSQINDVNERAKKNDREGQVGFALNAFVICRETEEEAIRVLQEIQGKADKEAVEGFRQQVQNAGSSTGNKSGMWANSKMEDLVQYNDGFKTKLIGTKEQIAERIVMLKSLGVNIILTAFLHYEEEIEEFGRTVIPLVRELERQGRGKNQAYETERTGHIYAAKNHEAEEESASTAAQSKVPPPVQSTSLKPQFLNISALKDENESTEGKRWAPPSWQSHNTAAKSFGSLTPTSSTSHPRSSAAEPSTTQPQPTSYHNNRERSETHLRTEPNRKLETPAKLYEVEPAEREEAAILAEKRLEKETGHEVVIPQASQYRQDDEAAADGQEAGRGNVGVQWDEPPQQDLTALMINHDMVLPGESVFGLDDGEDVTGQGNVGVQWEEPPESYQAVVKKSVAFQDVRSKGVTTGHEHGLSRVSGQGNIGLQWEEPPESHLVAVNHSSASQNKHWAEDEASTSAAPQHEEPPESYLISSNELPTEQSTAPDEINVAAQRMLEEMGQGNIGLQWEEPPESYMAAVQKALASQKDEETIKSAEETAVFSQTEQNATTTTDDRTFTSQVLAAPAVDNAKDSIPEADDRPAAQPSVVSLEAKQQTVTDQEVPPQSHHVVTSREETLIEPGLDTSTKTDSNTIDMKTALRDSAPEDELASNKESGRASLRSGEHSSGHRESSDSDGVHRRSSLFGRFKRRMGKAKWHSDGGIH